MSTYRQGTSGTVRRGVPGSVRVACGLMIAGAAAQVVHGLAIVAQADSIKAQVLAANPDAKLGTLVPAALIGTLVFTALWIWMSVKCRSGRGWARVTASIFFALAALDSLIGLMQRGHPATNTFFANPNGLTQAIGLIGFCIGLAAVVLLWTGESSRHFQ